MALINMALILKSKNAEIAILKDQLKSKDEEIAKLKSELASEQRQHRYAIDEVNRMSRLTQGFRDQIRSLQWQGSSN